MTKQDAIKKIMDLIDCGSLSENEKVANDILDAIEYDKLLKDSIDLSWEKSPERMGGQFVKDWRDDHVQ